MTKKADESSEFIKRVINSGPKAKSKDQQLLDLIEEIRTENREFQKDLLQLINEIKIAVRTTDGQKAIGRWNKE